MAQTHKKLWKAGGPKEWPSLSFPESLQHRTRSRPRQRWKLNLQSRKLPLVSQLNQQLMIHQSRVTCSAQYCGRRTSASTTEIAGVLFSSRSETFLHTQPTACTGPAGQPVGALAAMRQVKHRSLSKGPVTKHSRVLCDWEQTRQLARKQCRISLLPLEVSEWMNVNLYFEHHYWKPHYKEKLK